MAIDDELKAQILRYHFVEHWRVGTIASQLGVHHSTVERVLGEAGVERERQRPRRPSKLDSYMAFITETLERFPTLTAARLFDMVKARGYTGAPDHFRHRIAQLRPRRPREAYLRLRTLPGEQAQVDWAHFGKLTIGRAERPLMAFVLVLSYSRYPFVRFYLGASLECRKSLCDTGERLRGSGHASRDTLPGALLANSPGGDPLSHITQCEQNPRESPQRNCARSALNPAH